METYNGNYCVYVHTNKINGKKYVGQTCQKPEKRWSGGFGYQGCVLFWNAIKKYGWDGFEHEVVASNLTACEADKFEQLLIEKLNTMNSEYGYNLEPGGTKNKIISESTRKKISEAKTGEKNNFYGKHHSDESKQRMREANGGSNSYLSKKVFQYDLECNLVQEWESMSCVAKEYNVGRTTVMRYCRSGKPFLNKFILRLEKYNK